MSGERYRSTLVYKKPTTNGSRLEWPLDVLAGALIALKENGQPINPQYLQIHHDMLRQAIYKQDGGWRTLVLCCGFDPEEELFAVYRSRTQNKVLL